MVTLNKTTIALATAAAAVVVICSMAKNGIKGREVKTSHQYGKQQNMVKTDEVAFSRFSTLTWIANGALALFRIDYRIGETADEKASRHALEQFARDVKANPNPVAPLGDDARRMIDWRAQKDEEESSKPKAAAAPVQPNSKPKMIRVGNGDPNLPSDLAPATGTEVPVEFEFSTTIIHFFNNSKTNTTFITTDIEPEYFGKQLQLSMSTEAFKKIPSNVTQVKIRFPDRDKIFLENNGLLIRCQPENF